ncbi:MAG: hypothetical protein NE328_09260 [Lentisphaeraceae bacterium]|nr:hypothetical protein [Lentisphaeraceae bacterium]
MKNLTLILIFFFSCMMINAAQPTIEVKDIKIDEKLYNYSDGRIDETESSRAKSWAVVIVELDVKIPDSHLKNKFEKGKWLDNLTVEWSFLYKPAKLDKNINNYMRFTRTVEYTNVEEGENRISLLIDPATMKRYFDSGSRFKRLLFSKILVKHNGFLKDVKVFEGERVSDEEIHTRMFHSPKTYLINGILKTRLETPFRSDQTEHFLELKENS